MIEVADNIKRAYDVSTTQVDKIIVDNTEYRITNVEYYDDCYEEGNIFGTAIARGLEFEIENTIDLEEKEFEYLTGIIINGVTQWISLGKFITQEIEPNDTTEKNRVTAMDYMLKFNIPYESKLNYSDGKVTILDVLQEACINSGVTLSTTNFVNSSFVVDSNQFAEGTLNRQVIQAVAQISGTVAKIKNNNALSLINPNEITTISKVFSLNNYEEAEIKRATHPINLLSLGMKDVEGENIVLRDEESVLQNGENSLIINDNPFAYTQAKREQLITALFNAVKGFEYKAFSFSCQGTPYLETMDKIQFQDKEGNTYNSYLFRFNYKSPNGLESSIEAPSIIKATVAYQNILGATDISKRTELLVDKQNQTIQAVISNVDTQNQKISKVEQTVNELNSKITEVADLTTSAESIYATVSLENINESEPIYIKIYPVGKDISYLYPHDNLYPSDNLFPTIRTLRFTNTVTNEYIDYELPVNLLYYDSENYDEFILDYDSQSVVVNKRVGYNADGTTYVLENPTTLEFDFPNITLTNGNYTVELLTYETAYLFVRLMVQNIYTTQFATKAEVNSQINQTSQSIELSVDKKLENYPTNTEMNSAINIEANKIISNVSETYSTKIETENVKQEAIDTANQDTDEKLENYSTTVEMNSAITQKANEINLEVSKKVDNEDFTGANIMLAINDDSSSATINADKININGKAVNFETDIEETIGTYTADDLERVRQIILGGTTPTSEDYEKYDITGDGYISTLDYAYIGRAVSNGGTYTFSGKFKIDPYSAETSIGIYNNTTKRYTALLSLMGGEFNNLYANNIQTNFGENGERSSLSSTGLSINGSYLNDENLGSISAQVGSWYNNIQTSGIMIISPENENGNVNMIDIVAQADDSFISINGKNVLVPVTLYENSVGTGGLVTLSETVANFNYLEVFYVNNDGFHSSVKVENPDGKDISLVSITSEPDEGGVYIKNSCFSISGTDIRPIEGRNSEIAITGNAAEGTHISKSVCAYNWITKVIGYK